MTWAAIDIAEMIDAFGESVTIDSTYSSITTQAVFKNGYRQVDLGDGQIGTLAPALTLATSAIQDAIDAGEILTEGTMATVPLTFDSLISAVRKITV